MIPLSTEVLESNSRRCDAGNGTFIGVTSIFNHIHAPLTHLLHWLIIFMHTFIL